MSACKWQDVYLSKGADDLEYETMDAILTNCPDCAAWGWIVVPEHGCDGSEADCEITCPVPVQELCDRCKGTGRVL